MLCVRQVCQSVRVCIVVIGCGTGDEGVFFRVRPQGKEITVGALLKPLS